MLLYKYIHDHQQQKSVRIADNSQTTAELEVKDLF